MVVHSCRVDDGSGNRVNLLDSNGYSYLLLVNIAPDIVLVVKIYFLSFSDAPRTSFC